jgi:RHS repeat-associated protein
VRDIIDAATGDVLFHADYDAFGAATEYGAGYGDRLKYTAREYDADTGLQYNRARWYDINKGRWLSEDPIGFAAGDRNLYRYVSNASTNATDPSGLIIWFTVGVVVVGVILVTLVTPAAVFIPLDPRNPNSTQKAEPSDYHIPVKLWPIDYITKGGSPYAAVVIEHQNGKRETASYFNAWVLNNPEDIAAADKVTTPAFTIPSSRGLVLDELNKRQISDQGWYSLGLYNCFHARRQFMWSLNGPGAEERRGNQMMEHNQAWINAAT